jgi:hypothetical protein
VPHERGSEVEVIACSLASMLACSLASLVADLLTPSFADLLQKLTGSQPVKKFPALYVTPEGSLPHLQVPATFPYPEPEQSPSTLT